MKAVTYIVTDGKEVELEELTDDELKELGLDHLIEQRREVNHHVTER